MSADISCIPIPPQSALAPWLNGADFHDCHALAAPHNDASALQLYPTVARQTPGWVDALMRLRNLVAALFGLKNLGVLADVADGKTAADYRVGDRVGIFTLLLLSAEEVILGDADRHLEVRVSVCKVPQPDGLLLAVSTVVHIHNRLGRLYMAFVGPVHRRIVPALLRRADRVLG